MPKRSPPSTRAKKSPTGRADAFATVLAIGRSLPGVEAATAWGQPALKANGKTIACKAAHPSAEPDSLIVMLPVAERDALVEEAPATYYLKPHYVGHPCVLVRLTRIHPDALRDLLAGAQRHAEARKRASKTVSRPETARPTRRR
jgi:hypothetical protein